jgi:AraC-like DNA-binding protein
MLLPPNPACVLVQMRARTLEDAPAYRRMSRHEIGELAMARIASVPQTVTALLDEVPATALESTQIQLVHTGGLLLRQAETEVAVPAGSLVVYDADRPFEFVYPAEFRTTIVQVPTRAIDVASAALDTVRRRPLAGGSPFVRSLSALLSATDAGNEDLSENARRAVSRSIVETIRLVAREGAEDRGGRDGSRAGLAESASRYVQDHLDDPGLSAALVAARLHVSVRTLHAAFEDERETLGQRIRRVRLARARELLTGTDLSIAAVAEHVGYIDVTHFIRSFKSAEALTPARWRRAQLGTPVSEALG